MMLSILMSSLHLAEYLRGVGTEANNECSELFKEYSKCLQVRK